LYILLSNSTNLIKLKLIVIVVRLFINHIKSITTILINCNFSSLKSSDIPFGC